MLEWISVDGVLNQVRADAAVIEERIPFARCTVTGNGCALSRTVNEELDEVVANRGDGGPESLVAFQAVQARRLLRQRAPLDTGGRFASVFRWSRPGSKDPP